MVSLKFLKRFKMYSLNDININMNLKYLIEPINNYGLNLLLI